MRSPPPPGCVSPAKSNHRQTRHIPVATNPASNSRLISGDFQQLISSLSQHARDIHNLSPRRFEELVAEIWNRLGYEVELTAASRDGGRDVIARRKAEVNSLVLIECKKYAPERPVGLSSVQRLLAAVAHYDATHGVMTTTSTFTRDAIKAFGAKPNRLTGHEYRDLVRLLWRVQLVTIPTLGLDI